MNTNTTAIITKTPLQQLGEALLRVVVIRVLYFFIVMVVKIVLILLPVFLKTTLWILANSGSGKPKDEEPFYSNYGSVNPYRDPTRYPYTDKA